MSAPGSTLAWSLAIFRGVPGADAPPEFVQLTYGDNVSVSLSGDDADKLTGYYHALSEGGDIKMPLEKQVLGDTFGNFVDRFGIHWLVNIAGAADQSAGG